MSYLFFSLVSVEIVKNNQIAVWWHFRWRFSAMHKIHQHLDSSRLWKQRMKQKNGSIWIYCADTVKCPFALVHQSSTNVHSFFHICCHYTPITDTVLICFLKYLNSNPIKSWHRKMEKRERRIFSLYILFMEINAHIFCPLKNKKSAISEVVYYIFQ